MSILSKVNSKLQGIKKEYNQKKHFYHFPYSLYYASAMYLKQFGKPKHNAILKTLKLQIPNTLQKYGALTSFNEDVIADDCPIWVMWWQGEDKMPPIVKKCYNGILKYKGKHPVILLDQNNYTDYIKIAPPILHKLQENGWIQYVSDIVRFGLLSNYGGIWLDATLLVTQEIKGFNSSLYSIKHKSGHPKFVLDGYRWSSFMFACTKEHPYTSFIYDALLEYFTNNDYLIDYWLTDYIIATAYINNDTLRKYIDNLPLDNPTCLNLLLSKDNPYSVNELNDIFSNNRFNKLDWRAEVIPGTMLDHVMNS